MGTEITFILDFIYKNNHYRIEGTEETGKREQQSGKGNRLCEKKQQGDEKKDTKKVEVVRKKGRKAKAYGGSDAKVQNVRKQAKIEGEEASE